MGLIKMDLLGLEHLRIIEHTVENARSLGLNCPHPDDVPLNDPKIWNSISAGDTLCVFQMESAHMSSLCKRIKPRSIEELSLVNALGRPSGGQVEKNGEPAVRDIYMRRRDGKEPVRFKYDVLRPALEETLGLCVYQEQLYKIASNVAGWDLNKADGLRKLPKLKAKGGGLVEHLKSDFINDGASHCGLTVEEVEDIWDSVIEPFAGYGFNKSHGILYSINGYHSAYYKKYYPSSFMAAVLWSEVNKASSPDRDSNIRIYKQEAKRMGIDINVPDINLSGSSFTVLDEKTIVTGLAAVKGVGEKAVQNIIETRKQHRFKSFADFLLRTKSSLIRKNVIQPLAKAGCFDSIDISRRHAHDYYDVIRESANRHYKKVAEEGRRAWSILDDFNLPYDKMDGYGDWDVKTRLTGERDTLGEYVSGTANDMYSGFFKGNGVTSLKMTPSLGDGHKLRVESFITDLKEKKTKSGKNAGQIYADCSIQDIDGVTATLRIWPNHWNTLKGKLSVGNALRAICRVNVYQGNVSLVLDKVEKIGV